jgi:hypothetical protein
MEYEKQLSCPNCRASIAVARRTEHQKSALTECVCGAKHIDSESAYGWYMEPKSNRNDLPKLGSVVYA